MFVPGEVRAGHRVTKDSRMAASHSETCIADLDISFYPDGAKLHDVGCEHRKPVLCE